MDIDVKTIFLVNIVIAFAGTGACFLSWYYGRNNVSLLGWALGLALGGAGALIFSLRGPSSPAIMSVTANTLVVSSYFLVWQSVRSFNDGKIRIGRVLAVAGVFAACFSLALLAGADMRIQIILVSVLLSGLSLVTAWDVLKSRLTDALRSRISTAAGFALMGMAMFTRAAFAVLHTALRPDAFFDPTHGITLLINTGCIVIVTLGLLLMANERLQRRYARLASTDSLTGLRNRRSFLAKSRHLARHAAEKNLPACVLMMDLDRFSEINRVFGHAGGDLALAAFADCVRAELRLTDVIGRYGGEEFCVYLADTTAAEADQVAQRLCASTARLAIDVAGRTLRVTVSIGVSILRAGDLEASINAADQALYRAKERGRNIVCYTDRAAAEIGATTSVAA
jgi:diguanylate cyclase (GGDEF)-like protein